MKRKLAWVLRIAIAAVVAANVFYYALVLSPGFRALTLKLAGRSPYCDFATALRSDADLERYESVSRRLAEKVTLVRADTQGFVLWRTPKGEFWMPKDDGHLLPHLLAEQEVNIYGDADSGVRKGDIVLDCGAHVGVFSREALRRGARLVVAVEPAPENVECLRRNFVEEMRGGRLVVYPKGVWDRDDVLVLKTVAGNSASDSFIISREQAHEGPHVPLTTIDEIVPELRLGRVDFIKMDVEGAERRALAGASRTLRSHHPRLAIAAYHLPDDPERIARVVASAWSGYSRNCTWCATLDWRNVPHALLFRGAPASNPPEK